MNMMNFLKAAEKNKQVPPLTPSRLQGKQKKTKTITLSSKAANEPDAVQTNPTADDTVTGSATWTTVATKTKRATEAKKKKVQATVSQVLSDSDTDSDKDNLDTIGVIPEKNKVYCLKNQSSSFRYTFTMEIDSSLEPQKFLQASITKINFALKRFTTEAQLSGYAGKAVIIPWEDKEVYFNRGWTRVKRSMEHTKLLQFSRQILFGYGVPKGRKQDTTVTRKYCRIHVAWLSPDTLEPHKLESLYQYLSEKRLVEPDSFTLGPAPSMAINPTIAVQFKNSVFINPSNWSDKGHEDCLIELNQMIKSFLPSATVAGLKRATFSTGQNFMKGDPPMMSLECEKAEEQTVTRDILQAFRTVNRKSQVRDKCSVPWIAVPYFKGNDIQANSKYMTQYVDIKTKEATYQSGVMMKYVNHINALDTIATSHHHLSKELLKQLEQTIWDRNETPVRALIYDKLWDETYDSLLQTALSTKKKPSPQDILDEKAKISYHHVLDEMAKQGYETLAPYDEHSFPTPNPSSRTLREFLMTMKSRKVEDADKAPFVFESVNNTDDGRVLFTFSLATMEEATTILDCLPLVIQHEMQIDPSCFLSHDFIKMSQGSYYNPLSRTGVTAVAAFLEDEIQTNNNPKHRIPQAIRTASAKDIELLFKRTENKMFSFPDDSDLASIANSIASYRLPEINVPKQIGNIQNLQTLLQTHHINNAKDEEVISALSDSSSLSFDSKASKNRYEIERRADQIASKKADEKMYNMKLKQGLTLLQSGTFSQEMAKALELPYEDILNYHKQMQQQEQVPQSSSNKATALICESNSNDLTHADQMDTSPFNPTEVNLPDSDVSDTDSQATPLRGSPNKNMASGSQNAGPPP
jgi:hypothetical protein